MSELEDKTKEELIQELQKSKESISYWMKECGKYQNKYENLKNLIKSVITIIE
jgi:hypothetical protein